MWPAFFHFWQISGQCEQSGSRGERANIGQDLSEESSTPGKFCEIWYRWSIVYPSSPWRGETAASRDGNSGRVPRIIQSSNEQHSQVSVTFVTFTHPERVLFLGSGCKDIALYNVQGSISRSWQISGQCEQSGSRGERAWTILNIGQDLSEEYSTPGKFCEIWYWLNHDESMSYYVSIITLTWRDSCIKKWQFSTSTSFHPKFECATLPNFRHFRHLHSSWKGFDSGIRMQGYCLVQCSGVHQQVLADHWSVRTIWIARWKGMENFEYRPGSFGRIFNTWEILWDMISMIYWVSIITLTWRGSCIKRWQFWTSTSYHPKFECATLPNFRHFRHLRSSWKGFDSGIRMQGYCLVQCSGVHQQVLADHWSVRTIWIARWKGMENFEYRPGSFGRIFNTWEILWDMISMIYCVSIITLTWRDSCIKRWQFWTSTSYHPKLEWATLPSFRHFRHLHSSWKGSDSGIRMQRWCLLQCSGVHQQVLADQWSVQTILIARWKGIDNLNIFEHRPGSFERVFNTFQRACEIWYWLIMMNRWAMMYPSSPWRGETAASKSGHFRRVPRFIQSSNVQHT